MTTIPTDGDSPIVRHIATVARLLMGLEFFVFGLNGFFHFLPQPPLPEAPAAFFGAIIKTGYLFQLIMGTQLLTGILLLINRFVPLALALIAPVIVNIILFHLFLAPAGIGPGALALVLELYLAFAYRRTFLPMLAPLVTPG